MRYNYHTHTVRCHHAAGQDEEYVLAAIEAGFDEIGFSDHCAWPYRDYVSHMRMREDEIDEYVKSVKALKEKYKSQISVKLGWECEYFEKYMPWLRQTLEKYGFDYIILGHHFSPYEIGGVYMGNITEPQYIDGYVNEVLKALDTGLYSYIAHPDIFMRSYKVFDSHCEKAARAIIKKAMETDTPMEYNLLGFAHAKNDGKVGYPYPDFWKIAGEMGATAVIGIDAHKPSAYFDKELYAKAQEMLENYGVKFTDKIRFLRQS